MSWNISTPAVIRLYVLKQNLWGNKTNSFLVFRQLSYLHVVMCAYWCTYIGVIRTRRGEKLDKFHFLIESQRLLGTEKSKNSYTFKSNYLILARAVLKFDFQVLGVIKGEHGTPKVGCFFKTVKIQLFCCFIALLHLHYPAFAACFLTALPIFCPPSQK